MKFPTPNVSPSNSKTAARLDLRTADADLRRADPAAWVEKYAMDIFNGMHPDLQVAFLMQPGRRPRH
jgi:hypothetical protein